MLAWRDSGGLSPSVSCSHDDAMRHCVRLQKILRGWGIRGNGIADHNFNEHTTTLSRDHSLRPTRSWMNTISDEHSLNRIGLWMSAASHEHTTTISHERAFEAKDQEEQIHCFSHAVSGMLKTTARTMSVP